MWDFLVVSNNRKPKNKLPKAESDLSEFNVSNNNHLSSTWVGHSSLLINIDGYKIIADPVFEKKATLLFGPARFNGDIPFDINKIDDVDFVIISHNHYDHLNEFSIKFLKEKANLFIVPLMVGAQLEEWGIPKEKIIELDWWEEFSFKDLKFAATPAQHFSGRSITDRDKTLWASYVIEAPNHKIYFGGDSGYFDGFLEIGNKYGPFDMTFLECGAYNEKWHHIHMYPEETVQAHLDLKGKVLHPIHWGTFDLSLHSWFDPMERVSIAAKSAGIELALPIVGATTVYDKNIPSGKWWENEMKMALENSNK
ncbi:MAG: MBL fold metallo-hydrolase [Melioribacteraceae bacterium]|nr:MBL fold metallo-hydrolase [Melioribacteraceae bacterium]MCF8264492.1 MBL fold metallo-hydrolase [Melioribacteraceae bacterium]MCF8411921.1 MBL fold metallo-hydrolase [Melioribacteraceae bacterium]MCF8430944.1 MBL fold metallo-hydrolase [Melioribacteraceae bacterium]